MPFDDFQMHCTRCTPGQVCGESHVYVLLLDPSISSKRAFLERNPNRDLSKDCVYVGSTTHVPRCRQSQHMGNPKDESQWVCYCHISPGRNDYAGFWEAPSRFIKGYTQGYLQPKLFRSWNPVLSDERKQQEAALAEALRAEGYGVWSN
jgi:hypothetical protein